MTLHEVNEIAKLCYWVVGTTGWVVGIVAMIKYISK